MEVKGRKSISRRGPSTTSEAAEKSRKKRLRIAIGSSGREMGDHDKTG